MPKSSITVTKDPNGFVESGTIISATRKKVLFNHNWDQNALLESITFTGNLQELPTSAEMYQMATQNVQLDTIIPIQPNVWKDGLYTSTSSGSNVLWSTSANSRFRLLGGFISFSADCACANAVSVILIENQATPAKTWNILPILFSQSAAVAALNQLNNTPFIIANNGYLAHGKGNSVNVNFATNSFTAGGVWITVYGIEE